MPTTPITNRADIFQTIEELEQHFVESIVELKRLRRALDELGNPVQAMPAVHAASKRAFYDRLIIDILSASGTRMTFAPLRDAMAERGYTPHTATIRRYLKHLMRTHQIDNRQDTNPPG